MRREIYRHMLALIMLGAVLFSQFGNMFDVQAEDVLEVSAKAVILIESTTGTVIYEDNADEQLAPASVTKIMTLLLIFDALESGQITLEDEVVVSEYAASMGGSQIYLEAGEIQTVDTMIKSIAVASANDACVAMAEYISGSAEAFVEEMNERAEGLGMSNTNFINCNGLDAEGHVTTARDISLMSQELLNTYPEITAYTTIWMDTITHVTNSGSSEFGLTNTNKLLQAYAYTTGLKTGSTDDALFCISASATRDDINLIAVVMGAPTSADRTTDAITLLNYGFANCQIYEDTEAVYLNYSDIPVEKGVEDFVSAQAEHTFSYVDTEGNNLSYVSKEVIYDETLVAPIIEGDIVGHIVYMLEDKEIGVVNLVAVNGVEAMNFKYALLEVLSDYLL